MGSTRFMSSTQRNDSIYFRLQEIELRILLRLHSHLELFWSSCERGRSPAGCATTALPVQFCLGRCRYLTYTRDDLVTRQISLCKICTRIKKRGAGISPGA